MKPYHILLVLLVIFIWGINFIFAKLAVNEVSPLFLCALRFILASIPAIFFIKLPDLPLRHIIAYGWVMFGLQFGFVFSGIYYGMTPGMASVIMQIQVFFSIIFGIFFFDERPSPWQILGGLVSFSGIAVIGCHIDANMPLIGFLCILAAAASWGVGNLIVKKSKNINMMALVVWGSFFASFPMLIFSMIFEGTSIILNDFHQITWVGIISLLYIIYLSTWVGYGVWNWLLSQYPITAIVPFTLLIPIVGLASSVIFLSEPLQTWKIEAGLLVIGGLCINLLGARFFLMRKKEIIQEV